MSDIPAGDPATWGGWDGVTPLEVWRHQRRRDIKRWETSRLPMMSAVGTDGSPLYVMTTAGGWKRTKPLTKSQRQKVTDRDSVCVMCCAGGPFEVDHIVRYVDGGSNELENLRLLCLPCHRQRGGR